MTEAADVPAGVTALAVERSSARAEKDFAKSDLLRDEIASHGWVVKDTAEGFILTQKPPFAVLANLAAVAQSALTLPVARCTVVVLVDGWPDDLETCLRALLANTSDEVAIIGLDFGDVDSSGARLHQIAAECPARLAEIHIDQPLARAGWATAVSALAGVATSEFFAVIDVSTILTGDALTPILTTFEDPSVAGGPSPMPAPARSTRCWATSWWFAPTPHVNARPIPRQPSTATPTWSGHSPCASTGRRAVRVESSSQRVSYRCVRTVIMPTTTPIRPTGTKSPRRPMTGSSNAFGVEPSYSARASDPTPRLVDRRR